MNILDSLYVPRDIWVLIYEYLIGYNQFPLTCKVLNSYHKELSPKLPNGSIPQPYICFFSQLLTKENNRNKHIAIRTCMGFGIWKIIKCSLNTLNITSPLIITSRQKESKYANKFPRYTVISMQKLLKDVTIIDSYKVAIFAFATESPYFKRIVPELPNHNCNYWFLYHDTKRQPRAALGLLKTALNISKLDISPIKPFYQLYECYANINIIYRDWNDNGIIKTRDMQKENFASQSSNAINAIRKAWISGPNIIWYIYNKAIYHELYDNIEDAFQRCDTIYILECQCTERLNNIISKLNKYPNKPVDIYFYSYGFIGSSPQRITELLRFIPKDRFKIVNINHLYTTRSFIDLGL